MIDPSGLPLRDVHEAVAPPWWPPAPGWWLLAAACACLAGAIAWRAWRSSRRRREAARLFDATVAEASTPPAQVAAISELLRRAARRVDPQAATLAGEDWLRWLETAQPDGGFGEEAAALLRDGAFRRDLDAATVEALRARARVRYLAWMQRA